MGDRDCEEGAIGKERDGTRSMGEGDEREKEREKERERKGTLL